MKEKINIGLLGFGTVGKGIYHILEKNASLITDHCAKNLNVKAILVKDPIKHRNLDLSKVKITKNPDLILNDPDIQIIVEAIGGEEPAFKYICKALQKKKHVVTANKQVIAKNKDYLTKLAFENDVNLYFEAAVAGGIPIIQALNVGFAANSVNSIYGILNGTTNYILTKIEEEKKDFKYVLAEAQKLGFAEKNPAMDIDGLDAAYKLTILASEAFRIRTSLKDISYEGIKDITLRDITYALELGYKIKLLAIGKRLKKDIFSLSVQPTMIPLTHPLASIRNEFNAIYVVGDAVGECMLSGKGAGGLPTGSAVVSDIINIALNYSKKGEIVQNKQFPKAKLLKASEKINKFYIRLLVKDTYGVLEKIAGVFGKNKVSIFKVLQKDTIEKFAELVILTHLVKEENMLHSISELKKLSEINKICALIRVGLDEGNN